MVFDQDQWIWNRSPIAKLYRYRCNIVQICLSNIWKHFLMTKDVSKDCRIDSAVIKIFWNCFFARVVFPFAYSLLLIARFSCGYAYYAISYSVDQLSGDLYLNMFLLSVIDIPALISIWYLSNRLVSSQKHSNLLGHITRVFVVGIESTTYCYRANQQASLAFYNACTFKWFKYQFVRFYF